MTTSRGSGSGRTAMVTGAANGIGAATARRLARDGHRVALVDLNGQRAQEVALQMRGGSDLHKVIAADVGRANDAEEAVRTVLDAWNGIDVLVNCAGIAGDAAPIEEQGLRAWEQMIAIDLSSIFYFCRAVIPVMKHRKWGRIVNIASMAGKEGNPNMVPYSAAKAGVIGLTKSLAKEVSRHGIIVNSVAPAVIRTEILEQLTEEQVAYMVERIPMGRPGEPEEVAALVSWLASEECSFSTGFCYDISGGRATY